MNNIEKLIEKLNKKIKEDISRRVDVIQNSFEKFWEGKNAEDYIRIDDTFFHDKLEYNPTTDEWGIGTYSQNSWTPGWDVIHEFLNRQDIANMDSSNSEDWQICKEDLPTDLSDEQYRLAEIEFGGESEIIINPQDIPDALYDIFSGIVAEYIPQPEYFAEEEETQLQQEVEEYIRYVLEEDYPSKKIIEEC